MNDKNLKLCEIFNSISGEGLMQGVPSCFIRFSGCNMNCDYCDTKYHESDFRLVSVEDILNDPQVKQSKYFIVTGGEPFVQHDDIFKLIKNLTVKGKVEIETNGTNLYENILNLYKEVNPKDVILTIDLKLNQKGLEYFSEFEKGLEYIKSKNENYSIKEDRLPFCCIKVVVKDKDDIDKAYEFSQNHKGIPVIVSPCYNVISPTFIAEYIVEKNYNDLKMQIQLHKYLWEVDERGR